MPKPRIHVIERNKIIKNGIIIDYDKQLKYVVTEEDTKLLNAQITKNQIDCWIELMLNGSKNIDNSITIVNLNINKIESIHISNTMQFNSIILVWCYNLIFWCTKFKHIIICCV